MELLTNCMNNYFTRVMNMILAFDGDVVKFAGDSMIVTFAPSKEEVAASEDGGLYAATQRSMQCAHVLATRLGHMRMKMNGQVGQIHTLPCVYAANSLPCMSVDHDLQFRLEIVEQV